MLFSLLDESALRALCRFVFKFAQNDISLNDEEPFIEIVMKSKSFVRIYQERKSERGERM